MVQRLDDADGRKEPIAGVAEGREAPERPAAVSRAAVLIGDAGERAARLVVPGRIGPRATVEPAGVAVDEFGVDLPQRGFVAMQPAQRVAPHVGVDHVGPLDQAMEHG